MPCYNSFSYSLDKIKLKGKYKTTKHRWIPNKTKISIWCFYQLPEWIELTEEHETLAPFKYRYLYCLRVRGDTEGTFTIASWYNGDFKDETQRPDYFMIEYNPNKSGQRIYEWFCNCFIFKITEIVSFDIAYDIEGYAPQDVILDTPCDVMTYGKTSNMTLYIAPKEDESGRVKIYDKSKERQTKGKEATNPKLLRIECTIKCKGLDSSTVYFTDKVKAELTKAVNHLNAVKIKSATSETVSDWQLYALAQLTPEALEHALNLMSRNTKAQYKKRLIQETYFSLNLDVPTLLEHITTLIKPYLERIKLYDMAKNLPNKKLPRVYTES